MHSRLGSAGARMCLAALLSISSLPTALNGVRGTLWFWLVNQGGPFFEPPPYSVYGCYDSTHGKVPPQNSNVWMLTEEVWILLTLCC